MKFDSIKISEALPVKKVEGLGSFVFLAGPNGIGKSRLIDFILTYIKSPTINPKVNFVVSATSQAERKAWGGKEKLDLSASKDIDFFRQTFQQNKTRRNFKSSIILIESNRQIINVQPLKFTWDYKDPYEQELSWDYSCKPLSVRFQDTLHSIFKKIQSQKTFIANKAIQLKAQRKESMPLDFSDPLDPFRKAFEQVLSPKKLIGVNMQRNRYFFYIFFINSINLTAFLNKVNKKTGHTNANNSVCP